MAVVQSVRVETVSHFLQAKRRRSVRKSDSALEVPALPAFVAFSRKMQPAFAQIIERNVASGRWPGNFSFRCTHGFLSARAHQGFAITRRNVSKEGLTIRDFVWVSLALEDGALVYYGEEHAKPSIDAPVHRLIYDQLAWVQSIVHGHVQVAGAESYPTALPRWPCGAENEGEDILAVAPKQGAKLWIANVQGHGFVALIGENDPQSALEDLSKMNFSP